MEQPNREGHSPGRASQGQECRWTSADPECNLKDLERDPGRILQGPDSGSQKLPPSPDPKTPPLPLSVTPPMPSDLGQPRKLPLTGSDKKYPLMKQRGFYSDILSPGSLDKLGVSVAAVPLPSLNLPCGFHLPFLPFIHPSRRLSV